MKYKNIKQADFDTIKKLVDLGLTNKMIVVATGRSGGTIWSIKKASDWADYKYRKHEYANRKNKKEVLPEVKSQSENLDGHNSIVTLLRAIEHNQLVMIGVLKAQKKGWF